ncbi:MAG: hypothetical protein CV087_00125 [Candidatus Brocadia sp. WS118]|nr:MAG: hypothetical protein CV087_00125 [Candidatus Brocadia sp. WS118]
MCSIIKLKKVLGHFVLIVLERICYFFVKNTQIDSQAIKKILVSSGGGGIGDLLLALPAIEFFSLNFPHASISLLASSENLEVLPLFPGRAIISEVIDYDARGRHKGLLKKLLLILSLRKRHFNLSYFPSRGEGMRKEALMSFFIGASNRLGFSKGPVGLLNTVNVELQDDVSLLDQNLAILSAAKLSVQRPAKMLAIPGKDLLEARIALEHLIPNNMFPIISIHPGAVWHSKNKCWPIEKFISLIRCLLEEFNAKILIVGSKNELPISRILSEHIQNPSVLDMIGKTTIVQMAAFIQQSHLFIGNDSGPLHIALFLNVPSIAIFGSTSPKQILHSEKNCTIVRKNLTCSPCYLHQPSFQYLCNDIRCLKEITVDEVLGVAKKVLT